MSAAIPAPGTPLTAAQQARRDRIVAAGLALLREREYERIQVKDVAERAGVALGTLYRYFVSKDHLFADALLFWSASFRVHVEQHAHEGKTLDRVKSVYRRAARAFERQPRVYGVLLVLQATTDPYAIAAFRDFADRQRAAFAATLSRIPQPRRDDIIDVMSAVLAENLRSWNRGYKSIGAVYDAIDRAADLILGR